MRNIFIVLNGFTEGVLFFSSMKVGEQATRSSNRICQLLMKHGKPSSDGAIVKECLRVAAEEMETKESMSAISLSRPVVAERVEDLGADLKSQLKNLCAKFVRFSLTLDESTDIVDTAQLSLFIRGVTEDMEIYQELLDLVPLRDTITLKK